MPKALEQKLMKEAKTEAAEIIRDARDKAKQVMQEAEQTAGEMIERVKTEANLKSANIVNQSLEIASRMMNMAKSQEKAGKQKHPGARTVYKAKDTNHDYKEMIRFLIEDYRAGTLKTGDGEDLKEKLEALKEDDSWDSLSADVKALALINLLKHRVPET